MLLLHLAFLKFAPANFSFDEPLQTKPFLTRSVLAGQAPAVPVAPAAVARVSPAPVLKAETPAPAAVRVAPPAPAAQASAPEGPASLALAETVFPAPGSVPAAAPHAPAIGSSPIDRSTAGSATLASALPAAPSGTEAASPGSETPQWPVTLLVPASARLKYRVQGEFRGLPQSAAAELHWQHDGHSYEARLSVGILLRTRVQTSRGSIGSRGLMPSRFSDKSGSERAAHFERSPDGHSGQVIFSANTPAVALSAGAQDRLSALLQLAALLAGEPSRYRGITMQVVGARESDVWSFKIDGAEMLDLPYGRLASLKLTRSPRREYEQKVEVWLATGMGYLPVRVRITEPNGNFLDQQLSSIETP